MQPISKFNTNLGTAILLVGGAGSGKTVLQHRLYPKTYSFVADLNYKSAIDYLTKSNHLGYIIGWDSAYEDDVGKRIPPNKRYDWMVQCFTKAMDSKEVDAIAIDSWSFVEELIKVKISGRNDDIVKFEGKDTMKLWGDLLVCTKSIILQLRQSGKKVIITCHETKDKDESDGIYKYQLAIDGGMRARFPAFMSDVWRCEVEEKLGTYTWNLRMLSSARQEHLKRSTEFSHLKPVIPQDELVKYLEATRK